MKYKKYSYILLLLLMLIIGVNKTYAAKVEGKSKTCYYISEDNGFKASIKIGYGFNSANPNTIKAEEWARATVWKTNNQIENVNTFEVKNWFKNKTENGVTVPEIYKDSKEANSDPDPKCPQYVVYTSCNRKLWWGQNKTFLASNSELISQNVVNASGECIVAAYGSNYKNGKQITEDMFFGDILASGYIDYNEEIDEYTCSEEDMVELFGDRNDDGKSYDPDHDESPSIRYLINQVLTYVRIIVPILIILLGTLDFAKAVLAGKEDNMKKAQSDFVKRIIAGIAVFFVPTIVDIIMELADIVWAGEYTYCNFL